jgi:hypothetical protein
MSGPARSWIALRGNRSVQLADDPAAQQLEMVPTPADGRWRKPRRGPRCPMRGWKKVGSCWPRGGLFPIPPRSEAICRGRGNRRRSRRGHRMAEHLNPGTLRPDARAMELTTMLNLYYCWSPIRLRAGWFHGRQQDLGSDRATRKVAKPVCSSCEKAGAGLRSSCRAALRGHPFLALAGSSSTDGGVCSTAIAAWRPKNFPGAKQNTIPRKPPAVSGWLGARAIPAGNGRAHAHGLGPGARRGRGCRHLGFASAASWMGSTPDDDHQIGQGFTRLRSARNAPSGPCCFFTVLGEKRATGIPAGLLRDVAALPRRDSREMLECPAPPWPLPHRAKMYKDLDEVRAAESRRLARGGHQPLLKKWRWCLLRRKENFSDKQRVRICPLQTPDRPGVPPQGGLPTVPDHTIPRIGRQVP